MPVAYPGGLLRHSCRTVGLYACSSAVGAAVAARRAISVWLWAAFVPWAVFGFAISA